MENIKINKTFKSLNECKKWESENFKDNKYKGRTILYANHTQYIGDKEITLDSVMVI